MSLFKGIRPILYTLVTSILGKEFHIFIHDTQKAGRMTDGVICTIFTSFGGHLSKKLDTLSDVSNNKRALSKWTILAILQDLFDYFVYSFLKILICLALHISKTDTPFRINVSIHCFKSLLLKWVKKRPEIVYIGFLIIGLLIPCHLGLHSLSIANQA